MQLVGYSNIYPKDFGIECNIMVVKYLRENIGQEVCTRKGIYACLVDVRGSRDRQSIVVALKLLDLSVHNNNEKETNN